MKLNKRYYQGVTITELLIAMTIMAIVFSVLVPLFHHMELSWDSVKYRTQNIETASSLIEHLNRYLSRAAEITDVTPHTDPTGKIVFLRNDETEYCYDYDSVNTVGYGPDGDLKTLFDDISEMKFTCYGSRDLTTPINSTPSEIRNIEVYLKIKDKSAPAGWREFTTMIHLRTNRDMDIKLDIGPAGQNAASGYTAWSDSASISIGGTGFALAAPNSNITFTSESANPLGGDMVTTGTVTSDSQGITTLTIQNLPADTYSLIAYHNIPGFEYANINLEVLGAVSSYDTEFNLEESDLTTDSGLAASHITFTATGTGDVIIRFETVKDYTISM